MFCAKCGGAIPEGGGFCARCGAPARPITTPDGRLKRPGAVTLIAILDWISGGLWLLVGLIGTIGILAGSPADREPVAIGLLCLLMAIAAMQIVTGIGLWTLKPYGRILQLISSSIGLLAVPVGTIIAIVILVYLNKPGIKLLFSGKPVQTLSPEEQAAVAAATTSSGAMTVVVALVGGLILIFVIGIIAAIAVPSLLRARQSGNEAVAIGQLRTFTSAETSYALGNRLLFDRPDCLIRPSDCIPGYSGPAFLQEHPQQKSGYRFTFVPGLAPASLPDGASRSSLTSYVMTAEPVSNSTGQRRFCVDQGGDVRAAPLTAELPSDSPSCPAHWAAVR
jgi:hypothetical protein